MNEMKVLVMRVQTMRSVSEQPLDQKFHSFKESVGVVGSDLLMI